ncbi:MAG: HEPN domain-containing protein [candidate division NC10 bacterium]|nr:HEPN domain-containing protein [candidate division NC10 bacterium]
MTDSTGKDVKSWVDASRYDLETARALLGSRRYLYVLFMCQQSLEKLLKAHLTRRTAAFPPRIHSLGRLAELAGLELSQDDKALLERLSLYYLQSRYPPEIHALAKQITRSVAMTHLAQTEVLWKRLRRHLIRNK